MLLKKHIDNVPIMIKEEIIYYDAIAAISTKKEQNQIQKLILSHQKHVDKYKEYGSNDW